ncbi:terminase small subunit [Chloroflexota bacterium]
MNVALARKRHESFCLHYLSTMNGSQSALAAGYCAQNPKNAHITAWTLLKREDVQARLKELADVIADEAIMTVIQRKIRLSEIARASYDDPDRDGDPMVAIDLLNRMDGLYRGNKVEVSASSGSSTVVVVGGSPPLEDDKRQDKRHDREVAL